MQEELKFRKCDSSGRDFEILRNIHKKTMETPIVMTVGEWDEGFQLEKLKERYEESSETLKFLMSDDKEIGTINYWKKLFDDGSFFLIEQFYLLPEFQGTGLGGKVLREHLKFDITRLSVLNGDPNRMMFYKKRGFLPYKFEAIRTYFQWNPVPVMMSPDNSYIELKEQITVNKTAKIII